MNKILLTFLVVAGITGAIYSQTTVTPTSSSGTGGITSAQLAAATNAVLTSATNLAQQNASATFLPLTGGTVSALSIDSLVNTSLSAADIGFLSGIGPNTNWVRGTEAMVTNTLGMNLVGLLAAKAPATVPQLINTSTGAVIYAMTTNSVTLIKSGVDNPLYLTGNGVTNRIDGHGLWVNTTYIGTNYYISY